MKGSLLIRLPFLYAPRPKPGWYPISLLEGIENVDLEKDICERWAKDHGFELEYYPLEKGLGRLTRPDAPSVAPAPMPDKAVVVRDNDAHPERALGLDFSLPEG